MPPLRTQDRSKPRQDPVSCQLCRSKKLKCDRQYPCSNCQSRHTTCDYKGERPLAPRFPSGDDDIRAENRAIKARLQKLEEAIFDAPNRTLYDTSLTVQRPPSVSIPQNRSDTATATSDFHFLCEIGTRPSDVLPNLSDHLYANIYSIEDIIAAAEQPTARKTLSVPPKDLVLPLLDVYADYLDPVQHVMHVPSVRTFLDTLYANIDGGKEPEPGQLGLILAIAASVGFFWPFYDPTQIRWAPIFRDPQVASRLFTVWARQALSCVEHARISSQVSIEATQATILLMFLLFHLEGFSARTRLLQSSVYTMARDLGLHKIDAPNRSSIGTPTQADIIKAEVGRKVWWHITSTDWFLGFQSGPHEGSYSIHPRHMLTNKPRNLSSTDLETQGRGFSRDLSEPTVMSYYLHRIKLATVCREAVDMMWSMYYVSDPVDDDVAKVELLDTKFLAILAELPRFMHLDVSSAQLKLEYGEAYEHSITLQRAVLHLMAHSRRCKLHLPFLLRFSQSTAFSGPRQKCLDAARGVFAVRHTFDEESGLQKNIGGILYQFAYAAMVLALDLCMNNRDDQNQLAEVREILKFLDRARGSAKVADTFLNSLTDILRKHKVDVPANGHNVAGGATTGSHSAQMSDAHLMQEDQSMNASIKNGESASTLADDMDFDAFFEDFLDYGQHLDAQDWDAIFNELEMRTI